MFLFCFVLFFWWLNCVFKVRSGKNIGEIGEEENRGRKRGERVGG